MNRSPIPPEWRHFTFDLLRRFKPSDPPRTVWITDRAIWDGTRRWGIGPKGEADRSYGCIEADGTVIMYYCGDCRTRHRAKTSSLCPDCGTDHTPDLRRAARPLGIAIH